MNSTQVFYAQFFKKIHDMNLVSQCCIDPETYNKCQIRSNAASAYFTVIVVARTPTRR